MSKILIAYFSRAGENYVGGAVKKKPYSEKHNRCIMQARVDLTLKKRPELVTMPNDMDKFLEAFGMSGKRILPFCTHALVFLSLYISKRWKGKIQRGKKKYFILNSRN